MSKLIKNNQNQTTYDGFKVLRVSPINDDGLSYLKNLSLNNIEVSLLI